MKVYSALLAVSGVPRLLAAAVLSRVSTSMLTLSVALAVMDLHGSTATAGLALTAQAMAIAVGAPAAGRLADRFGPRPVLFGYLAAHGLSYLALTFALVDGRLLPLVLAAVALGGSLPPSSAVLRGHWPVVVPAEQLHTAFAVDSVSNSAMFIIGPPLAGLLALLDSPWVALGICAASKLGGDLLLATTRGLPGRRTPPGGASSRLLGALQDGRVRLILCVVALDTFGYGCLNLAAVSLGVGHGPTAGVLLGLLSVGEVLGGLIYGSRRWQTSTKRQLTGLHAITAAILVAAGAVDALPLIGLFYLAAGTAGGARDTVNQVILTQTAPDAFRTESFAWLTTFMWAGFGLGTMVAGQLQSRLGTYPVFLAAGAAALLAAFCTLAIRLSSPDRAASTPERGSCSADAGQPSRHD